jgi:uncharacterized protein (DUF952 family)
MTAGQTAIMLIYKILRDPEWKALEADGSTRGAPVDLADGYVHFSTASQLGETAARHFAGVEGLWLLAVDPAALTHDLRWEPSRGGQDFPHLYAPLRRDQVLWARPLPLGDDGVPVPPDDLE